MHFLPILTAGFVISEKWNKIFLTFLMGYRQRTLFLWICRSLVSIWKVLNQCFCLYPINPNLHGPNFNLIHMGGACHNPKKTNVMTNFKTFSLWLSCGWMVRASDFGASDRRFESSQWHNFLPRLNCIFFAFLSMYRNGRPHFEIGIAWAFTTDIS